MVIRVIGLLPTEGFNGGHKVDLALEELLVAELISAIALTAHWVLHGMIMLLIILV